MSQQREQISIDGVSNIRGFGGFHVLDPPEFFTKHGRIIRSGHLENLTSAGYAQLLALSVSKIFDLRSVDELVKADVLYEVTSHLEHSDIKIKEISLPLQTGDFSPIDKLNFYRQAQQDPEIMSGDYFRIITSDAGMAVLRAILLNLLQHPDETILIHCSLGKDRTGIIFAIILLLAGVTDEEVARDYAQSQRELEQTRGPLEVYIRSIEPAISTQEAEAIALQAIRTDCEYMLNTLRLLRDRYGSITDFVCVSCQWSQEQVDVLKASLICKC